MAENSKKSGHIGSFSPKFLAFIAFAVALFLALVIPFFPGLNQFLDDFGKGIARLDDVIVRVFGLGLLIYSGTLFLNEIWPMLKAALSKGGKGSGLMKVRKTTIRNTTTGRTETVEEPKKDDPASPFQPFFALMKFGAVLGLSGASLFGAYELDQLDKGAYGWPPGQKPVSRGGGPSVSSGGGRPFLATGGAVGLSAQGGILARWLQVVPSGKPGKQCWVPPSETSEGEGRDAKKRFSNCSLDFLVRAVVAADAACPSVGIRYAGGDAGAQIRSQELAPRGNPNLDHYPVRVCEGLLADRDRAIAVQFPDGGSISISEAWRGDKEGPKSLAIFGDTGCRDNRDQDCTGSGWSFETLSGDIARNLPDLVIHLGDYIYGGGDHWAAWQHEFFRPARRLLETAPWVMVRGNHESCGDDAPRGWLLFFDYRPDGVTDTCANTDKTHLVATYALDLNDKIRLIVADSSKA